MQDDKLIFSRKKDYRIWHIAILLSFVALYIGLVTKYCWTLPAPSDPCQYISPVVWKSTGAYFLWIERLMMPIGIYIVSMFFRKFILQVWFISV